MAPASAPHENNVFYLISAILRGILGRYLERAREGAKLRDICRDSIVVFWGVGEAPVLLLACPRERPPPRRETLPAAVQAICFNSG
jgi:hypothetical protein